MARLVAGLALVFAGAVLAACEGDTTVNVPEGATVTQSTGITVNGSGEARGVPDIAMVNIGIEAQGATVAEARSKGAEAATRLIASLKANGLQDRDIRTTNVSIQARYEYPENREPRIVGYTAMNMLVVTIRSLDNAGKVIDDGVAAGGDSARLQGIAFGFDNPEALLSEARTKAIENARKRAEDYAKAAGVKVGQVEVISEFSAASPYPDAPATGRAFADEFQTPIQPGETTTTVTVTVRYAIER